MNLIKYINNLSIQALTKLSAFFMIAIVVVGLSLDAVFTKNINELNKKWHEHSQTIIKKTALLGLIQKSLGYGGMIHHVKNYVLRGNEKDLIEAHFHILELKTFISAYYGIGVGADEQYALSIVSDMINKYYLALYTAEKLRHQGLSATAIDAQVRVDDQFAFHELLKLELLLFEKRKSTQDLFSETVSKLANFSVEVTVVEAIIFIFFLSILGWVFRRRILEIYAREVDERRKSTEQGAKIDTMLNSMMEGLVTINSKGIITSVNTAIVRMYGYEKNKLIGQNVKILVPAPHYANHDAYLRNYMETGQAKIIGKARELESVRANNQSFPIELNVSEMEVEGERHFVGIIRDISDRKTADRAKKHFIATVSHELRTPLTAIQGALGMITTGVLGVVPDKIENLINVSLNNTKRLTDLVNDLLDLEKLDSGQMSFEYAEHPLAEIIGNAYYANLPYAEKYNVKLNLTGRGRGLNVWVDDKRIEQVVTNLLSNAIKFSPEGEFVTINFVKNGSVARVEVIDKGVGIADEFENKIFKRFSQSDNSDSRTKGGTGLGLSISKVIIENHGGNIGFERNKDRGTTFYFELPLVDTIYKQPVFNNEFLTRRIIVVEDTHHQAEVIGKTLKANGFSPIVVSNLAQARNQLHTSRVECLIIDIDETGLERALNLVENIRLNKRRDSFPIVFISTHIDSYKNQISPIFYEVNLWLEKPLNMLDLVNEFDRMDRIASKHKRNILLIDSNHGLVVKIKKHLEHLCNVTFASSLSEAQLCYNNIRFDLFIIDPDILGKDLLSLNNDLKKIVKNNDVGIIYYTTAKSFRTIKSAHTRTFIKDVDKFDEFLSNVKEYIEELNENKN